MCHHTELNEKRQLLKFEFEILMEKIARHTFLANSIETVAVVVAKLC